MDYYDTEYKDPVTNRGKIIIILTIILLVILALFLIGYLTGNIHFGKTNTKVVTVTPDPSTIPSIKEEIFGDMLTEEEKVILNHRVNKYNDIFRTLFDGGLEGDEFINNIKIDYNYLQDPNSKYIVAFMFAYRTLNKITENGLTKFNIDDFNALYKNMFDEDFDITKVDGSTYIPYTAGVVIEDGKLIGYHPDYICHPFDIKVKAYNKSEEIYTLIADIISSEVCYTGYPSVGDINYDRTVVTGTMTLRFSKNEDGSFNIKNFIIKK